jgi:hypothetical protein
VQCAHILVGTSERKRPLGELVAEGIKILK